MDYGRTLYDSTWTRNAINWYVKTVRKLMTEDESIIGLVSSGSSGAIIAGNVICRKMPRRLVYLHLQKEPVSHGKTSGIAISGNYIFIDDFISNGETFHKCRSFFVHNPTYQINVPFAVVWSANEVWNKLVCPNLKNVTVITRETKKSEKSS